MASRQMPQNKEAEMSVLGVAFLSQNALCKVCEEVLPEMFYSEQNRKIFIAIKNLYDAKIPVDITTIKEELDKKKELNSVGGIDYISEIIDSVATTANIDYYIKIIKEKAVVRNLIDTATGIITEAYESDDNITNLLDNAEKNILNVGKFRRTTEFRKVQDVLTKAQEDLETLSKNAELYLFTSRNLMLATKWLINNNLDKFFKDVTNIKLPSYLYIDDRTICFKGDYQKTLEEIENFKVYWK